MIWMKSLVLPPLAFLTVRLVRAGDGQLVVETV